MQNRREEEENTWNGHPRDRCHCGGEGANKNITAGTDHLKPDNRNRGTLQEKTPPTMVPPPTKTEDSLFLLRGGLQTPNIEEEGGVKGYIPPWAGNCNPKPEKIGDLLRRILNQNQANTKSFVNGP